MKLRHIIALTITALSFLVPPALAGGEKYSVADTDGYLSCTQKLMDKDMATADARLKCAPRYRKAFRDAWYGYADENGYINTKLLVKLANEGREDEYNKIQGTTPPKPATNTSKTSYSSKSSYFPGATHAAKDGSITHDERTGRVQTRNYNMLYSQGIGGDGYDEVTWKATAYGRYSSEVCKVRVN